MAFNLTRRDAVVLIASTLALGCSQKAKAPVSAIDLSRFRFNSLLFNDQEVVAGDDALSVTAGDVFIIQGAGKIAAGSA